MGGDEASIEPRPAGSAGALGVRVAVRDSLMSDAAMLGALRPGRLQTLWT